MADSSSGSSPAAPARRQLREAEMTSISGAVSGWAATISKQPIQRLKWIRQISSGPVQPYNEVLRQSLQADGVTGLFRGSTAAICRNVPHSALVYTIYPMAERSIGQQSGHVEGQKPTFAIRFWAGYATLFAATLVTHPLDTMRVRISVTHGAVGVSEIWRDLVRSGNWRALYHGFGATLIGAGPRGAVGFGIFETLKDLTRDATFLSPAANKFLCGYIAGFVAETAIYPLDTVRRRQQALGDATELSRRNVLQALTLLWRSEGFVGMFKGLSLNLFKNPLGTAVSFAINDLVKDYLRDYNRRAEPSPY